MRSLRRAVLASTAVAAIIGGIALSRGVAHAQQAATTPSSDGTPLGNVSKSDEAAAAAHGKPAPATTTTDAPASDASLLPPPPPDIQAIMIHGGNGAPSFEVHQDNKGFHETLPQAGVALTPSQIEEYQWLRIQSELASQAVTTPHVARAPMVKISLAPGQVSPPINLALGFGTAISFHDSTGQPWPITSAVLGNNVAFNEVTPTSKDHNVIDIASNKIGARSDVIVTLKGLNQPVVMLLVTSITSVDLRVMAQINRRGPNAEQPVFVAGPSLDTASSDLMDAVNGIAPPGGHRVLGNGDGLEVWRAGSTMYVRSHAELRLPPNIESQVSAGGYTAWKLPYTPSITLAKDGQYKTVQVPSE